MNFPDILRGIITHVYGKIKVNSFEDREYGGFLMPLKDNYPKNIYKKSLELACKAARNIEVIDGEKPFDSKIAEHIHKAKSIFILGFGFYEDNMRLLDLWNFNAGELSEGHQIPKDKKIYYTNYGDMEKINAKVAHLGLQNRNTIKKSTNKVYAALEQDFPDN